MTALKAPFPWFGGKRKVAAEVWARLGAVDNYVEPFFGSGAVLLGRPNPIVGNETINDLDGYVANFWRAIQHDPEAVAVWADVRDTNPRALIGTWSRKANKDDVRADLITVTPATRLRDELNGLRPRAIAAAKRRTEEYPPSRRGIPP